MQYSVTPVQAVEVDVMDAWEKRALQQRAAFDALAAYMRGQ